MNEDMITLWALGGASAKTLQHIDNTKTESDQLPELNKIYIDTSDSELSLLNEDVEVNLIDTGDSLSGSGAVKGTHFESMKSQVPAIVNKSTVSKIHFVVCSVSGASGSTAAYVVVEELLSAGKSVVVFATSTTNSINRAKNTTKTMASFDNLAKKHKSVLPIYISVCSSDYNACDRATAKAVLMTSAMLNEEIVGIDDTDRKYFLNPMMIPDNKDSGMSPGVAELSLYVGKSYNLEQGNVAGCLTLVPYGAVDDIGSQATAIYPGVLDPDFVTSFINKDSQDADGQAVSLILNRSSVYTYINTLVKDIKEKEKTKQLNTITSSMDVGGDDHDGCIL